MAVGKYSPTVSAAYQHSQTWWKPKDEISFYDDEGFDSYGYNEQGYDRAGNHENDYLCGEEREYVKRDGEWDSEWFYSLYEDTLEEWTCDKVTGKPVKSANNS